MELALLITSCRLLLAVCHRIFGQDDVEVGTVTLQVNATALYGPDPGTLAAAVTDSATHALSDRAATLDLTVNVTPSTIHDAGVCLGGGGGHVTTVVNLRPLCLKGLRYWLQYLKEIAQCLL